MLELVEEVIVMLQQDREGFRRRRLGAPRGREPRLTLRARNNECRQEVGAVAESWKSKWGGAKGGPSPPPENNQK